MGQGNRHCWNSDCASSTGSYDPVVNDPPAPTSPDSELLNNDHSLLHGGKVYLDAVNLAGNKLPDDPTLAERAFPVFFIPKILMDERKFCFRTPYGLSAIV